MCEKCHNALQELLSERGWTPSDEQLGDFLWSATCFPFGDGETIVASIREAFDGFGDAPSFEAFSDAAAAHAEAEMESVMAERRAEEPPPERGE